MTILLARNHAFFPRSRLPALSLGILRASLFAYGEPTPAAPTASEVAAASAPSVGEPVMLNPFEVQADSDTSYGALNSNSITRFNIALDKLPITADIFDQAFMDDVGMQNGIEGLIETYSAGAGFAQSDPASSAANSQPGDRNGNSYIQLRGLSTPSMQRDGFMINGSFLNPGSTGVGFSSSFDIERVEIVNGPQSLLYGAGGGGGVINTVSKQARFGHAPTGSVEFKLDQYGHKTGQFDYGMGTDNVAFRFALIQQTVGGRRQDIGGPMEGYYAQVAFRLFRSTTVRVVSENTTYDRENSQGLSLAAASTSNDSRNGQNLRFLLASNQIATSRIGTGTTGAGVIDNGFLNWNNVDSYAGWQAREITVNRYSTLIADTEWNSWLSSEFSVGYDDYYDDRVNNTLSFYSPNNTSNPLGVWAIGETGGSPMSDTAEPSRTKGIRFSLLAANDLFGGRVHSKTSLGADYIRGDQDQITYDYFLADSNFNLISGGASTINGGHTIVPKVYWPVDNGLVQYPLWEVAGQNQVTYNGANYVRAIQNPPNPALVSAADPQGVAGTSGHYLQQRVINKGIYGVNYTQWLDKKLDTIFGFRYANTLEETYEEGVKAFLKAPSSKLNFNAGADYAVGRWLHPYVSVSDSVNPPPVQATDPYGAQPKTAQALGEEFGLKVQNPSGTISGSLAIYATKSANEEYLISSTLLNDINPSGLNGAYNNGSNWINVDRRSRGAQAVLSVAPTANWRMRLSAAAVNGQIGTATGYAQLYNDQFYENNAGQVTYADGTVVYVNPTFNSKAALTVTASTAGAIPLTVAAMSTSSNAYFANPVAISGQINSSSNAAKVLEVVDPVHGPILTGATGLPISQQQINPGFTPPGVVPTSAGGDLTTGYPEFSGNLTDVYTFASGWPKGFRIGETFSLGWRNRQFYYYPNGVTPGATRTLFYFPQLFRVDLILGYSHKMHKVTWGSQLNVSNLFNRYHVVLIPNPTSGWTGTINATFDQQPRAYVWTNTLKF